MPSTDTEDPQQQRVPNLVQLCQRAASAHVDSICSLGNDLTYELVKPILDRCTIEQLLRFEQLSPHLQKGTTEIWKDLCYRKFRLTVEERYSLDEDPEEPDSWKSRYFLLQDAEAQRIEELGSKLRTQRREEIERKKGKEVKYTDRVPDAKRARTGWNTTIQPKTLFQRTKSEASKIQRAYHTRVLPPMPSSKNYRVLPKTSGAILPPVSPSVTTSRVTVNTVIHRRPSTAPSTAVASSTALPSRKAPASIPPPPSDRRPHNQAVSTNREKFISPITSVAITSTDSPPRVPLRPPAALKKDPMTSMFVPKRKNALRLV